jgi:GNAT superfamily N-acetyltransferase
MADIYDKEILLNLTGETGTPESSLGGLSTGNKAADEYLQSLPDEERAEAFKRLTAPLTGEDIAARMEDPNYDPDRAGYKLWAEYKKNADRDIMNDISAGAQQIFDQMAKTAGSAVDHPFSFFVKAGPSLVEALMQGTRGMYGLVMQSQDPNSIFFQFADAINGRDTDEGYRQFLQARQFQRDSIDYALGKKTILVDKNHIDHEFTQMMSYIADPTLFVPFAKVAGLGLRAVGMGEKAALIAARVSGIKAGILGGALKYGAGKPIEFIGGATRGIIDYGLETSGRAFETVTGVSGKEFERTARMSGIGTSAASLAGYGVPMVSDVSNAYLAGSAARGVGEAISAIGTQIQRGPRGVLSYAKAALIADEAVLSPHAKALLKVINGVDPMFSFSADIVDGAATGAFVGGGLGYLSAGEEGLGHGIGAGVMLGGVGGLAGRMVANITGGTTIARADITARYAIEGNRQLGKFETARAYEAFRKVGEITKTKPMMDGIVIALDSLAPDAKYVFRNNDAHYKFLKEKGFDPETGEHTIDPNSIDPELSKYEFRNMQGAVVEYPKTGETIVHINTTRLTDGGFRGTTVPHEIFHLINRKSVLSPHFIENLKHDILGVRDSNGKLIENGSVEASETRQFFKEYVKRAYGRGRIPDSTLESIIDRAVDEYEKTGQSTFVDAAIHPQKPILEHLTEEFGAYYFENLVAEKPADWLFFGGKYEGVRGVLDRAVTRYKDYWEHKVKGHYPRFDFRAGKPITESFKRDGKRIRVSSIDEMMSDFITMTQNANRTGRVDISLMSDRARNHLILNKGLDDLVGGKGKRDIKERERALRMRGKEMHKELLALGNTAGVDGLVLDGNGDFVGRFNDTQLDALVRVGHMSKTMADKIRTIQRLMQLPNRRAVIDFGYWGRSHIVEAGPNPARVYGDEVPFTNRTALLLNFRTKIGKNGDVSFQINTLDAKVMQARGDNLWADPAVRALWGGNRDMFKHDFLRYLENLGTDPARRVDSSVLLDNGDGNGAKRRDIMHQHAGVNKATGDVYINSPLSEVHPDFLNSYTNFSVGLMQDIRIDGSGLDVVDHNALVNLASRNFTPDDMPHQKTPNGIIYKHKSGYEFHEETGGKTKAYDNYGEPIGVFDNKKTAMLVAKQGFDKRVNMLRELGERVRQDTNKGVNYTPRDEWVSKQIDDEFYANHADFAKEQIGYKIRDLIEQQNEIESKLKIQPELRNPAFFETWNEEFLKTKKQINALNRLLQRIDNRESIYSDDFKSDYFDSQFEGITVFRGSSNTSIVGGGSGYFFPKHFLPNGKVITENTGSVVKIFGKTLSNNRDALTASWDKQYPMTFRSSLMTAIEGILAKKPDMTFGQLRKHLLQYGSRTGERVFAEAEASGLLDWLDAKIPIAYEVSYIRELNPETGRLFPRGSGRHKEIKRPILEKDGKTPVKNPNVKIDIEELREFLKNSQIKVKIDRGGTEYKNVSNTEVYTAAGDRVGYGESAVRINDLYKHGTTGHYGPNSLVHHRQTIRYDNDGNKYMYIEEVQVQNKDRRKVDEFSEMTKEEKQKEIDVTTARRDAYKKFFDFAKAEGLLYTDSAGRLKTLFSKRYNDYQTAFIDWSGTLSTGSASKSKVYEFLEKNPQVAKTLGEALRKQSLFDDPISNIEDVTNLSITLSSFLDDVLKHAVTTVYNRLDNFVEIHNSKYNTHYHRKRVQKRNTSLNHSNIWLETVAEVQKRVDESTEDLNNYVSRSLRITEDSPLIVRAIEESKSTGFKSLNSDGIKALVEAALSIPEIRKATLDLLESRLIEQQKQVEFITSKNFDDSFEKLKVDPANNPFRSESTTIEVSEELLTKLANAESLQDAINLAEARLSKLTTAGKKLKPLPLSELYDTSRLALLSLLTDAVREGVDNLTLTHPDDAPAVSNMDFGARHGLYGKSLPEIWQGILRKYGIPVEKLGTAKFLMGMDNPEMMTLSDKLGEMATEVYKRNAAVVYEAENNGYLHRPADHTNNLGRPLHEFIFGVGANRYGNRGRVPNARKPLTETDAYKQLLQFKESIEADIGVAELSLFENDKIMLSQLKKSLEAIEAKKLEAETYSLFIDELIKNNPNIQPERLATLANLSRGLHFKLNDQIKADVLSGKILTNFSPDDGGPTGGRTYDTKSNEWKRGFIGRYALENPELLKGVALRMKNWEGRRDEYGKRSIELLDGKNLVGRVDYEVKKNSAGNYMLYDPTVYVEPKYRGKGYSNLLFSEMAERARYLGAEDFVQRIENDEGIPMHTQVKTFGFGESKLVNPYTKETFQPTIENFRKLKDGPEMFIENPDGSRKSLGRDRQPWVHSWSKMFPERHYSPDDDYRGSHRAPSGENGEGSLDAMNRTYPDDLYSPNGARYYGMSNGLDKLAHQIILKAKGNPDAEVSVYRAVPKGVKESINAGDWVTTVRQYAEMHGERFKDGMKIIEKKVRAGDLFTEGNSIFEFGWNPSRKKNVNLSPDDTPVSRGRLEFDKDFIEDLRGHSSPQAKGKTFTRLIEEGMLIPRNVIERYKQKVKDNKGDTSEADEMLRIWIDDNLEVGRRKSGLYGDFEQRRVVPKWFNEMTVDDLGKYFEEVYEEADKLGKVFEQFKDKDFDDVLSSRDMFETISQKSKEKLGFEPTSYLGMNSDKPTHKNLLYQAFHNALASRYEASFPEAFKSDLYHTKSNSGYQLGKNDIFRMEDMPEGAIIDILRQENKLILKKDPDLQNAYTFDWKGTINPLRLINQLRNAGGKEGNKAFAEAKAIGLIDWLEMQSGGQGKQREISTGELLDFIEQNKLGIYIDPETSMFADFGATDWHVDGNLNQSSLGKGYKVYTVRVRNPKHMHGVEGHFVEAVVHMRVTFRDDANGKRVMHIEEIQANNTASGVLSPKEKAKHTAARDELNALHTRIDEKVGELAIDYISKGNKRAPLSKKDASAKAMVTLNQRKQTELSNISKLFQKSYGEESAVPKEVTRVVDFLDVLTKHKVMADDANDASGWSRRSSFRLLERANSTNARGYSVQEGNLAKELRLNLLKNPDGWTKVIDKGGKNEVYVEDLIESASKFLDNAYHHQGFVPDKYAGDVISFEKYLADLVLAGLGIKDKKAAEEIISSFRNAFPEKYAEHKFVYERHLVVRDYGDEALPIFEKIEPERVESMRMQGLKPEFYEHNRYVREIQTSIDKKKNDAPLQEQQEWVKIAFRALLRKAEVEGVDRVTVTPPSKTPVQVGMTAKSAERFYGKTLIDRFNAELKRMNTYLSKADQNTKMLDASVNEAKGKAMEYANLHKDSGEFHLVRNKIGPDAYRKVAEIMHTSDAGLAEYLEKNIPKSHPELHPTRILNEFFSDLLGKTNGPEFPYFRKMLDYRQQQYFAYQDFIGNLEGRKHISGRKVGMKLNDESQYLLDQSYGFDMTPEVRAAARKSQRILKPEDEKIGYVEQMTPMAKVLQSTAGYSIMVHNNKFRVYGPNKVLVGIYASEQEAKRKLEKEARKR